MTRAEGSELLERRYVQSCYNSADADTGRVWAEDEASEDWMWLADNESADVVEVSFPRSLESSREEWLPVGRTRVQLLSARPLVSARACTVQ